MNLLEKVEKLLIEAEGENFLSRVASGFSLLAKEHSWVSIKGGASPEVVSRNIEGAILQHFRNLEEVSK